MKMSDEFDIDETLCLLVEMRREQRLAFFKDAVQTFWRGWRAINPTMTPEQFVEEVAAWRDMIDRADTCFCFDALCIGRDNAVTRSFSSSTRPRQSATIPSNVSSGTAAIFCAREDSFLSMPASARVGVRFSVGTALVPIPIAPLFSPTVSFCALIIPPRRRSGHA